MNVYLVESFEREFEYDGRHSVGVECEGYPRTTGPVFLHLIAIDQARLRSLRPHSTAQNAHGRLAIAANAKWWFQGGRDAKAHWPGIRQLRNRGANNVPVALFEVAD